MFLRIATRSFPSGSGACNSSRMLRKITSDANSVKYNVNHAFIEVKGKDAKSLLQGICTNDTSRLVPGACIAAAFLNPKGRVLADTIIYDLSEAQDSQRILIEVHEALATPLARFLSMYRLRSQVVISTAHSITSACISNPTVPVSTLAAKPQQKVILSAPDPRCDALGQRFLLQLNSESEELPSAVTQANASDKRRWVPSLQSLLEGTTDGPQLAGEIPLECNLDLQNYVAFKKGCYVGQELVARTKFKGLVRKRLLPFYVDSSSRGAIVNGSKSDTGSGAFAPLPDAIREQIIKTAAAFAKSSSGSGVKTGDQVYLSHKAASLAAIAADEGAESGTLSSSAPIDGAGSGSGSSQGAGSVTAAGRVVAVSACGTAGLALVRLEHVLSEGIGKDKDQDQSQLRQPNELYVAARGLIKSSTTGSASKISNSSLNVSNDLNAPTFRPSVGAVRIRVFRPKYWQDIDLVTGKPLFDGSIALQ